MLRRTEPRGVRAGQFGAANRKAPESGGSSNQLRESQRALPQNGMSSSNSVGPESLTGARLPPPDEAGAWRERDSPP